MNRTTKIYLKETQGKGMGVFAAEDIKIYKKGMLASFYVSGHLSIDLGS